MRKSGATIENLRPIPALVDVQAKSVEIEAKLRAIPKPIYLKAGIESFHKGETGFPYNSLFSHMRPSARIVYALFWLASDKKIPNREIIASLPEISKAANLSRATVVRALSTLRELGMLTWTTGYSGRDKAGVRRTDPQANAYRLTPVSK